MMPSRTHYPFVPKAELRHEKRISIRRPSHSRRKSIDAPISPQRVSQPRASEITPDQRALIRTLTTEQFTRLLEQGNSSFADRTVEDFFILDNQNMAPF